MEGSLNSINVYWELINWTLHLLILCHVIIYVKCHEMSIWSPSLMVELVTFWARTLLWWWVNLTRKSSKISDQLFQYFKIKFGFDAVMWDWQLEKIEKIFKKENLEIHSTKINLTQKMNQSWQAVGGVDKSMGGFMAPHEEFLRNIERYRFNRLLDIGRYIRLRNVTP